MTIRWLHVHAKPSGATLIKIPFPWVRVKWQDAVFAIGEIVFTIGLLPSVFSAHKPAPLTSLVTAVMLTAFLAVYVSYRLWLAFIFSLGAIGLWFTLFFQVAT